MIATFYVVVLGYVVGIHCTNCNGSPHTCPTEFKLFPSTTQSPILLLFLTVFLGGSVLFVLSTTLFLDVTEYHSNHPHSFVDDTQIRKPAPLHHVRELVQSVQKGIHDVPCSGELRTQKLKCHSMRTRSSKVLPLRPGVGQYMAINATLTARDYFLANFYPSGPFTCIFSKSSPEFFLC